MVLSNYFPPYIVQRCVLRPDRRAAETLLDAVSLDLMGYAEFEFGAIPRAWQQILENRDWAIHTVMWTWDGEGSPESPLFVGSSLTPEAMLELQLWLQAARNPQMSGALRTKCRVVFDKQEHMPMLATPRINSGKKIDLWWDLRNDIVWSFDQKFMCDELPRFVADARMRLPSKAKLWTKRQARKYAFDLVARVLQHVIDTENTGLQNEHAAALVEEQLLKIAEQMHERAEKIFV